MPDEDGGGQRALAHPPADGRQVEEAGVNGRRLVMGSRAYSVTSFIDCQNDHKMIPGLPDEFRRDGGFPRIQA